jgi:hypothetical protein
MSSAKRTNLSAVEAPKPIGPVATFGRAQNLKQVAVARRFIRHFSLKAIRCEHWDFTQFNRRGQGKSDSG